MIVVLGETRAHELTFELFKKNLMDRLEADVVPHMGWATISTARTSIEAKVMVTERVMPGHVGVPYHWGWRGLVTGRRRGPASRAR